MATCSGSKWLLTMTRRRNPCASTAAATSRTTARSVASEIPIAPANADVWARSLLPFGERPAWGSISLDPGASLVEALKWLTYASTFFAASVLGARRGTQLVLALVVSSATLLAVVTVSNGLLDARKVFGVYEPTSQFLPHHVGPLLNANNLAGYLTLGAITGVGLMLVRSRSQTLAAA